MLLFPQDATYPKIGKIVKILPIFLHLLLVRIIFDMLLFSCIFSDVV